MTENDRIDEQPQEPAPPRATDETRELPPADAETATNRGTRPKLTRVRSEGMLAGVAAGLGKHFNVDPVVFRIGFGVSLFFGGFGALAYLALALFLPDEAGQTPVKSSRLALGAAIVLIGLILIPAIGWGFWSGGGGWDGWGGALWLIIPAAIAVGAYAILKDRGGSAGGALAAVLIAAAAATGFFLLALIAAAVTALGFGEIAAGLVVLAGLALIVGAFSGSLRWLIVPALALALGVGAAAAADIEVDDTIGHREYTPLRAGEIPDEGYEVGIGQLDVDLREMKWKPNQVVALNVDVGLGQGNVLVPSDVCVDADVSAKSGSLVVAGEQQQGFGAEVMQSAPSNATPRLEIKGDVQFGELRVLNDDDRELGVPHGGVDGDDGPTMREARAVACAP